MLSYIFLLIVKNSLTKILSYLLLFSFALSACRHINNKRFERLDQDESIFETQRVIGQITDNQLDEVSGLVASVKNPGLFWTHNDSGGKPWIYLIDTQGVVQLTAKLQGVKNRDWEDLALGNGQIYIAEIGDNDAKRDDYKIYQFAEPEFDSLSSIEIPKDSIRRMKFIYENGPRDAESLMYDHFNEELVIVSKRDQDAFIYSLPFKKGKELQIISPLGTIPFCYFTAGDSRSNGDFVIKSYDHILYWKEADASIAERLLNVNPIRIPYQSEPQGEAIAFDLNGDLVTTTEKVEGFDQNILRFMRK